MSNGIEVAYLEAVSFGLIIFLKKKTSCHFKVEIMAEELFASQILAHEYIGRWEKRQDHLNFFKQ